MEQDAIMAVQLPFEIWRMIFSYLDQFDLIRNVSMVNKTFYDVANTLIYSVILTKGCVFFGLKEPCQKSADCKGIQEIFPASIQAFNRRYRFLTSLNLCDIHVSSYLGLARHYFHFVTHLEASSVSFDCDEFFPSQNLTKVVLHNVRKSRIILTNCNKLEMLSITVDEGIKHYRFRFRNAVNEFDVCDFLHEIVQQNSGTLEILRLYNHFLTEDLAITIDKCRKLSKFAAISQNDQYHKTIKMGAKYCFMELSNLPNLKALEFLKINFKYSSKLLRKIIQNLEPSLENLTLWQCRGTKNILRDAFKCQNLKSLKLHVYNGRKLKSVHENPCPKLEVLHLVGCNINTSLINSLSGSSRLKELKIVSLGFDAEKLILKIQNLLDQAKFSNHLKVLSITSKYFVEQPRSKFSRRIQALLDVVKKNCQNLKELRLPFHMFYEIDAAFLEDFLVQMKNLKTFSIKIEDKNLSPEMTEQLKAFHVLELTPHLRGFVQDPDEEESGSDLDSSNSSSDGDVNSDSDRDLDQIDFLDYFHPKPNINFSD